MSIARDIAAQTHRQVSGVEGEQPGGNTREGQQLAPRFAQMLRKETDFLQGNPVCTSGTVVRKACEEYVPVYKPSVCFQRRGRGHSDPWIDFTRSAWDQTQ